MSLYDTAVMLAGQFAVPLILDNAVERGRVVVVPGESVSLNPADKDAALTCEQA